jgi:hypothetical protein
MLIDLHAHYPMRAIGDVRPDSALHEARRLRGRPRLRDKVRALVLRIASTFFSHRDPFPATGSPSTGCARAASARRSRS